MTSGDLTKISQSYFYALDHKNFVRLGNLLTDQCALIIETHNLRYSGKTEILELFRSRWENSKISAVHHDFKHIVDVPAKCIVTTFKVTYSGPEAPPVKSNANIFQIQNRLISTIQIYMAGANTVQS